MSSYTSRVGFLIATLPDPRFDPLTPWTKLFSELGRCLIFEIWDTSFCISVKSTPGEPFPRFEFAINAVMLDVLESFETRVVSPSLLTLIQKMKFTGWERGSILAEVTDYRRAVPKTFRTILRIGHAVRIYECSQIAESTDTDRLEVERRILELSEPVICTDPCPSVARLASAIDWRSKMWIDRKPRRFPVEPQPAQHAQVVVGQIPLVQNPSYHPVRIPPDLQSLILTTSLRKESTPD
jgi:hypothetical protein